MQVGGKYVQYLRSVSLLNFCLLSPLILRVSVSGLPCLVGECFRGDNFRNNLGMQIRRKVLWVFCTMHIHATRVYPAFCRKVCKTQLHSSTFPTLLTNFQDFLILFLGFKNIGILVSFPLGKFVVTKR